MIRKTRSASFLDAPPPRQSTERYPKIMAQSWRPAARCNRLALAGWSEAIPRYNDAFRAPLATGRPVINFGRLDELRASATPYSWVMKL